MLYVHRQSSAKTNSYKHILHITKNESVVNSICNSRSKERNHVFGQFCVLAHKKFILVCIFSNPVLVAQTIPMERAKTQYDHQGSENSIPYCVFRGKDHQQRWNGYSTCAGITSRGGITIPPLLVKWSKGTFCQLSENHFFSCCLTLKAFSE